MNNPNFPSNYDPNAYDNSISNGMTVDTNQTLTPNQNSTAANFAAAYYGFPNFGDQLHFSNFSYLANQNSTNYLPIPTTTFPSTSLQIPPSIQSNALYPQQSTLAKQSTTTNNGPISSTFTRSTKSGIDRLLIKREKPKRKRVLFTADQIRIMEEHFKQKQFTQHTERIKLSHLIGLSPQQIKIWYQNRRYKEKLCVRGPGNSEASTLRRIRSSPLLTTQGLKMEDEVKLECKQDMENQIMAMQNTGPTSTDYFPSIYSNWPQPNQQPSPFFPFNTEMYSHGFPGPQLNNPVNYPQMLQNGFNPLAYYNPTNANDSLNPN